MKQSTERAVLAAILVVYLVLGITYSVVTPLFEASDELWHYPMVKFVADTRGGLPVQDPANPGPWKQEGGQPPLYYYLGALATFWIDTSDMPQVRRENPHVDNGIVTPDGNVNLVVHNREAEAFPWQGTALAVHIVRLLSVLMGAGTVYCTYALAKELFPDEWIVPLGSAGLVAFLPMFLFISGSVNNDNLSNLLSGLLLLMLVRMVKYPERVDLQSFAAVGVTGGLGLLAKYSVGFLLVLTGAAFFYVWYRRGDWRLFAKGTLLAAFLTILIAGWWYERNLQLYGDPTGLNVFNQILGVREVPAGPAQLWRERTAFLRGFWGLFGGLNVPMADWAYVVFDAIGLLALAGLAARLIIKFQKLRLAADFSRRNLISIGDGQAAGRLLALVWPVLVFVSWSVWASVTWSSQGRLVFSALTALMVWLAYGLATWGRWLLGAAAGFFLLCAALAPFVWVAPAYVPPAELVDMPDGSPVDFYPPGEDRAAMRLLGYDVFSPLSTKWRGGTEGGEVTPGDRVEVTLYWEILTAMARDWSVFVHLTDSNGVPIAQRDRYPGGGLLATSDLAAGRMFAGRYVIRVPAGAYAPDTLTVNVGVYDYTTCPACQRMHTESGDSATLREVALAPASDSPYGVPNPMHVNFGGKAELVGYALDRRRAAPGERITLTLYWHALASMDTNYTVFAHVIGAENRIWANGDAWPAGGAAPTGAWEPGDIIEDTHTLPLDEDTPPGMYPIEVGFYTQAEAGGFTRLVVVTGSHEQERDFVYLSKIRVND